MSNPLYRHPTDRVIGGVAAGLAAWLNVDPSLVRIAWVVLAVFSGGVFVLVYIVMLFVVPLPPPGWIPPGPGGAWSGPTPPASGGTGGWQGGPTWHADAGTPPQPGGPGQWQTPASPWSRPGRSGNGGIVVGLVLILLGVWFLVAQYVHIEWSIVWPVIVIVAGAALVVAAARRGPHD